MNLLLMSVQLAVNHANNVLKLLPLVPTVIKLQHYHTYTMKHALTPAQVVTRPYNQNV